MKQPHPKTPHKYKLKNLSNSLRPIHSKKKQGKVTLIWACILPKCPHYIPNIELGEGKESLCHGCDNVLIINQYHIGHKILRPLCNNCLEFKRNKKLVEESDNNFVRVN